MFATNCLSKSIKNADQNFTDQLFLLKDQIKENVIKKLHAWNFSLFPLFPEICVESSLHILNMPIFYCLRNHQSVNQK